MQLSLLPRELSPDTVLQALEEHVGKVNGMTATELAEWITGRRSAADERRLRQIVEQLRTEGHPVCSHPATGYYRAASEQDIEQTCAFLIGRAMTSLRQACAMRRVAVPDLYGQLGLPLETQQ